MKEQLDGTNEQLLFYATPVVTVESGVVCMVRVCM